MNNKPANDRETWVGFRPSVMTSKDKRKGTRAKNKLECKNIQREGKEE